MDRVPNLPGADEVHLWAVRTDPFPRRDLFDACLELLADDERAAAARFRTDVLTERYVVSHALLRDVLADSTGVPATELRFAADSSGRPHLHDRAIDFNLSHTKGMAVVAVAARPVGVDVERLRDGLDLAGLGSRVLSARERESLGSGTGDGSGRFFDYWTLKEAYAKALGVGVRLPFRDIDVRLGDRLMIDLQAVDDDATGWRFELFGDPQLRVALAVKADNPERLTIHAAERLPTTGARQPWPLSPRGSSHSLGPLTRQ